MKALAWILTAAAILIGADVFVLSSDPTAQPDATPVEEGQMIALQGGSGMPPPPPD